MSSQQLDAIVNCSFYRQDFELSRTLLQLLRANGSVASTLSRDMLLLLVVVPFRGRGLGFGVHQGHQSTAFAHSVQNDEKKYHRTNLTNIVKAASRNLPSNSKKRTPQTTGYQTMLTLLIPN